MFLVEAEELLRAFVNPLRVKSPELSIWTGVAKIKRELTRLHLDRHGIRRWRSEVDAGPCLYAEDSQCHDFDSHHQQRGNHQRLGSARKALELGLRAAVGKLPHKKRQQELCGKKGDSRL